MRDASKDGSVWRMSLKTGAYAAIVAGTPVYAPGVTAAAEEENGCKNGLISSGADTGALEDVSAAGAEPGAACRGYTLGDVGKAVQAGKTVLDTAGIVTNVTIHPIFVIALFRAAEKSVAAIPEFA